MSKILIAGGSGSIGKAFSKIARENNYEVKILTRQKKLCTADSSYLYWSPINGELELNGYQPNHVVNLSGAGIADEKWTKNRKKLIIDSRVKTTKFLITQFKKLGYQLDSFISASAIGYYGDTGDNLVDETSDPITDEFISEVCVLWEQAAAEATSICSNLTILRISTVLFRGGGALSKMDKTIPFGMANYLGNGKQYLSWIHIEDLCHMILHTFTLPEGHHIFNAVADETPTNFNFTKTLRDVINPKALLMPAPSFSLKLILGEMSKIVLNSSLISNEKIKQNGFSFKYPNLKEALKNLY